MLTFSPLRELPKKAPYKKGDVLVLFGELFARGYANGLVEQAQKLGMTIIYSTVGRREKDREGDNSLRALTPEELALQSQPFINIPLEAGFDMEPSSQGITPCDQLKELKMSDWPQAKLDFQQIEESKTKGIQRFKKQVRDWAQEVEKHIPPGANVLVAHLMAGGVPRAKICMPAMNRVFKGKGDRYFPSLDFWQSDLGKLCSLNFMEVTALTLQHLIEETSALRAKVQKQNAQMSYVAYGYHGTEVLINNKYEWQSYAPYLQGWAKIQLEKVATHFHDQGVAVSVYNAPEILTNSSGIFQGVELPLYPLLKSLQQEAPTKATALWQNCRELLKDEHSLEEMLSICDQFLNDPYIREQYDISKWPVHSRQKQLEMTLTTSEHIMNMHKNDKNLISPLLSEVVFDSCGYLMLHAGFKPQNPIWWIGHDIVAKTYNLLS